MTRGNQFPHQSDDDWLISEFARLVADHFADKRVGLLSELKAEINRAVSTSLLSKSEPVLAIRSDLSSFNERLASIEKRLNSLDKSLSALPPRPGSTQTDLTHQLQRIDAKLEQIFKRLDLVNAGTGDRPESKPPPIEPGPVHIDQSDPKQPQESPKDSPPTRRRRFFDQILQSRIGARVALVLLLLIAVAGMLFGGKLMGTRNQETGGRQSQAALTDQGSAVSADTRVSGQEEAARAGATEVAAESYAEDRAGPNPISVEATQSNANVDLAFLDKTMTGNSVSDLGCPVQLKACIETTCGRTPNSLSELTELLDQIGDNGKKLRLATAVMQAYLSTEAEPVVVDGIVGDKVRAATARRGCVLSKELLNAEKVVEALKCVIGRPQPAN